uniref:Phospholipid scramblase n=1 Tax=Cyprinus carpio carpio TaxID=630221 RepID=A0A8C1C316_CYPCA
MRVIFICLRDKSDKAAMQPMNMYMVPNQGIPGFPPGLEYLTQVDQLLIKQKVELIEALAGFESNNKYEIRNSMGQNVFYAVEENDCLTRQCCGPLRSFTIRILDNFGQEIITVSRPLKCMSCFFPCCLQELEIQAPPGNTVGYVLQQWHPFLPKFTIENERREPVLKLQGPFCGWSCLPDVDFEILTMDEVSIGKISKQWTGLLREAFTDSDNFGIQFPMDLDVRMKAVMIGACFLIDFMFFETNN